MAADEENQANPELKRRDSYIHKVREAKAESSGCVEFCAAFCVITAGTVGVTILLIIALGIPVSMIIIGAYYRNRCPMDSYIPIWLMEWGIMMLARKLAILWGRQGEKKVDRKGVYITLDLLITGWTFLGSILVFSISKHYNTKEFKCDETLYLFSFIILVISLIGIAFALIGVVYKLCTRCKMSMEKTTQTTEGESTELANA